MEAFTEQAFEQKLFQLKDTHDSIASLSSWCLYHQEHHTKIVATWLSVLKRVRIEHRLLMFYLANDVIQYSKRKHLPFVDAYAPALQKATTMVRDESIRNKILRLFKIWDDRSIYDESFLVDLSGLLTHGNKANRVDIDDFQPSILYSRLKSCKALEKEADFKLKLLSDTSMTIGEIETLQTTLKDRKASEDVVSDIDDTTKKLTTYIDSLEAQVKEERGLIDLLEIGEQYYERDYGEAKVVVNAYKSFTNRVKLLSRKLDGIVNDMGLSQQSQLAEGATNQQYGLHGSFMGAEASNETPYQESQGQPSGQSHRNSVNRIKNGLFEPYYVPKKELTSYGNPKSEGFAEQSTWEESSYPSLDQRLALHKFSLGGLKVKSLPSPPPSPPAPPPPQIHELQSNFFLSDVQPIKTQILDTSTELDPLSLQNWEGGKDFESPESPPTFEKRGIPRPNDDIDMRAKDIDHRNLISLTDPSSAGWSPLSEYGDETTAINPGDDTNVENMELSDDDEKKSMGKSMDDTMKPVRDQYNVQVRTSGYDIEKHYDPSMTSCDSFLTSPMLLAPPPPPPPPPPAPPVPSSPVQVLASQPPPPPPPPLPPLPLINQMKEWPQQVTSDYIPRSGNYSPMSLTIPPPIHSPTTPNSKYPPRSYNSSPHGPPSNIESPNMSQGPMSPYGSVQIPPPPPPPPNCMPYNPMHMNTPNYSHGYGGPVFNVDFTTPPRIIDFGHGNRPVMYHNSMKKDIILHGRSPSFNSPSSSSRYNSSNSPYMGMNHNHNNRISAAKVIPTENTLSPCPETSVPYSPLRPVNERVSSNKQLTYSPSNNTKGHNNSMNSPQSNPNSGPHYNTGANIRVVHSTPNMYNNQRHMSPNFQMRPNLNNNQFPYGHRMPYKRQGESFPNYKKWS